MRCYVAFSCLLLLETLLMVEISSFVHIPYSSLQHTKSAIATIARGNANFNNKKTSNYSKINSLSISKSDSVTITVPQFYPNSKSPKHQNIYPSSLHKIHITPSFLTIQEARKCLELSKTYAQQSSCWNVKDSERHTTYSTNDFAIEECDILNDYLESIGFNGRVWNSISDLFDIDVDDLSFLDFFVAHYEAKNNDDDATASTPNIMDHLEPHRDGSLISFTIVLSKSDSYEGGGTVFDALRDVKINKESDEYNGMLRDNGVVRVKTPGDAVFHSGKLKHGGNKVTKGERTVMVGFVDVNDRCMRDGVMKEACKEWGRCDVAENRLNRQINMLNKSSRLSRSGIGSGSISKNDNGKIFVDGWYLKDLKYMNNKHIGGFIPAFTSVMNRGNKENQRRSSLETEDILLRDLLLPRHERYTQEIPDHILAQFGGDVTIL